MCTESPNSIRDWSSGSAKTFNHIQMMFWIAENCPLWSFWYALTHAFESVSTFVGGHLVWYTEQNAWYSSWLQQQSSFCTTKTSINVHFIKLHLWQRHSSGFRVKAFSHSLHWYGFSLACILKCIFRWCPRVNVLSRTASFKLFRVKEVKSEWLPQKSLETSQLLHPIVAIFPSKMQEIHWYQNITPQSESRGRCSLHSDLALDIGYMPQLTDLPCTFLLRIEYGQLFYHHRTTRLNSYKPCRNGTPLEYIGNALFYIRHANHFQHLWSVLQPITFWWTILRKVFCG